MILAGQLASEDDVKRFYTEAEAAANLDHPGIVPIYEIGEHDGQHYFSMAFVEGDSLSGKLADGPLPPREAADLTRQIAEAIAYAHEQGVIHRDLKPGNVLLDRDSQTRVTDFGLAKRTEGDSELTGTGQILGTASYMPPEQASGKTSQVGPLADVYSLGALLYCLLTGRPPFQAASVMDTLMQVIEQEPVPPRQLNPNIPADLETICLKCLQKETAKRYASARELAADLARFHNGEPILARPVGTPERAWRWCRRNPIVSGLSAAVAMALVVGIGVSTYYAQHFEDEFKRAEGLAGDLKGSLTKQKAVTAEKTQLAGDLKRSLTKQKVATAEKTRLAGDLNTALVKQKAETNRAEWQLYASHISRAQAEWNDADVPAAWASLNACRLDFRGWEHDYLFTLFNSNQLTLAKGTWAAVSTAWPSARTVGGSSAAALTRR